MKTVLSMDDVILIGSLTLSEKGDRICWIPYPQYWINMCDSNNVLNQLFSACMCETLDDTYGFLNWFNKHKIQSVGKYVLVENNVMEMYHQGTVKDCSKVIKPSSSLRLKTKKAKIYGGCCNFSKVDDVVEEHSCSLDRCLEFVTISLQKTQRRCF